MMKKEIYGLSRSRDKAGKVVKRSLNPYVNCIHSQVGGARDNMEVYIAEVMKSIKVPEATLKGYAEAYEGDSINLALPNSKTRRGRVGKQMVNTLDTGCQQGVVENYRIRKLTPRECFRLMGVDDSDIDKLQSAGISNSQQYKLAGNSIVVDVLYHIFRKMFIDIETEKTTLF